VAKSKFFKEFSTFIARGNVVDMSVGIIVGGAFTTIVNALVNNVFTPFINWIIYIISGSKDGGFTGLDIILIPATYDQDGNLVKSATILSFSALLSAILNFLLIALVLFLVIKGINTFRAKLDAVALKEKTKIEEKFKKKKDAKKVDSEENKEDNTEKIEANKEESTEEEKKNG